MCKQTRTFATIYSFNVGASFITVAHWLHLTSSALKRQRQHRDFQDTLFFSVTLLQQLDSTRRVNYIRIHRCYRTLALHTSGTLNVAHLSRHSFIPFLTLLTTEFPAKPSRTKGKRYRHVSSPAAHVSIAARARPLRNSTSLDNVRFARRRSRRKRKKRRWRKRR